MTFWGYVGLLFFIGLIVENYQFTQHELELERIKALNETKKTDAIWDSINKQTKRMLT